MGFYFVTQFLFKTMDEISSDKESLMARIHQLEQGMCYLLGLQSQYIKQNSKLVL